VVVAEAMDAVLAGEIGLLLTDFRNAQVVVAEVCRERGLDCGLGRVCWLWHLAPLGESRAPPRVVFRDRVVLGEVKNNYLRMNVFLL
jgi:hypothetical protein